MPTKSLIAPERTAERVALWRALHVEADPAPLVFDDTLGLQLLAPDDGWRKRPDMSRKSSARARASIVARARYIEDLISLKSGQGVKQVVLLGAGIDTFAQRKSELASQLQIFEVDQPGPQAWKVQRLEDLGHSIPKWLHMVPFDFEAGNDWPSSLQQHGFDSKKPAVVTSTGVFMYLTRQAIESTLQQVSSLAKGTTFAISFMLPLELLEEEERPQRIMTEKYAKLGGTPFLSLFKPADLVDVVRESGFHDVKHISSADLAKLYFAGRSDSLRPSSSEELVVATV